MKGKGSRLLVMLGGTSLIERGLYPAEMKNFVEDLQNNIPVEEDVVNKIVSYNYEAVLNDLPDKLLTEELAFLKRFGLNRCDVVALLSTDTEDGKFCTRVNKQVLDKLGLCEVLEPIVITGMKTRRTEEEEDIIEDIVKPFINRGIRRLKEVLESLNSKDYAERYLCCISNFPAGNHFLGRMVFESGIREKKVQIALSIAGTIIITR